MFLVIEVMQSLLSSVEGVPTVGQSDASQIDPVWGSYNFSLKVKNIYVFIL